MDSNKNSIDCVYCNKTCHSNHPICYNCENLWRQLWTTIRDSFQSHELMTKNAEEFIERTKTKFENIFCNAFCLEHNNKTNIVQSNAGDSPKIYDTESFCSWPTCCDSKNFGYFLICRRIMGNFHRNNVLFTNIPVDLNQNFFKFKWRYRVRE